MLLLVRLASHSSIKLAHSLLKRLDNVRLELAKVLLHGNQVGAGVVLLCDLLGKAVVDAALEEIRVVVWVDFGAGGGVVGGGVLAEELDVLCCFFAGFVDGFGAFADALFELFLLGFDFGVERVEDGEDLAFKGFGGLLVDVGNALESSVSIVSGRIACSTYLSVCPDVIEHLSNTSQVLRKVIALLKRVLDCLIPWSVNAQRMQ